MKDVLLKVTYFHFSNFFFQNREQRVVSNGQISECRKIHSGVPQGLVLGSLLFLIYINNLPDGIPDFSM